MPGPGSFLLLNEFSYKERPVSVLSRYILASNHLSTHTYVPSSGQFSCPLAVSLGGLLVPSYHCFVDVDWIWSKQHAWEMFNRSFLLHVITLLAKEPKGEEEKVVGYWCMIVQYNWESVIRYRCNAFVLSWTRDHLRRVDGLNDRFSGHCLVASSSYVQMRRNEEKRKTNGFFEWRCQARKKRSAAMMVHVWYLTGWWPKTIKCSINGVDGRLDMAHWAEKKALKNGRQSQKPGYLCTSSAGFATQVICA